jgi:MoaA/NifB/PqqE/SkfB family radical SAM enzyme
MAIEVPVQSVIRPYLVLAKNIFGSNWGRLHFPYKLTYAITYLCNYRCQTCNIWKRRPAGEMTLSDIQQFFRHSNKFSWIDLTGGEVFLRKDFLSIVETILTSCRNLLLLHFPTNGYLTDIIVSSVRKIASWKPPKLIISVSLDGDETVNDFVRGIKGGWRRQIETYKQLHAIRGVQVVLGMTLSGHNADQIELAFRAAQKECAWLTYDDFHVNIAHVSGHYYGNEGQDPNRGFQKVMIEELGQYLGHRRARLDPMTYLEKKYLTRIPYYLQTGRTPIRCQALRSSCFIDPWGNIYPCGMYDHVLGNLKENNYDLSRIWNSGQGRRLQREIWKYQCPQCWTPCEAYQTILGALLRTGT